MKGVLTQPSGIFPRTAVSLAVIAALSIAAPAAADSSKSAKTSAHSHTATHTAPKASSGAQPAPADAESQHVATVTGQPTTATEERIGAKTSSPKSTGKDSHAARVDARIAELRSKLKVTAAQQDKWDSLTQVMRENAQQLDALSQARMQNTKMTAVEDLNTYSQMADAHAEGLKKFIPAFQALYDSMSEPQKKQADAFFQQGHSRMAGRTATGKSRS